MWFPFRRQGGQASPWAPAMQIFVFQILYEWERSGSEVECLSRDREAVGTSLTGVTALWSLWARHIYPSLVLVQPRKTRPCLTERLLMGRKELDKKKKNTWWCSVDVLKLQYALSIKIGGQGMQAEDRLSYMCMSLT